MPKMYNVFTKTGWFVDVCHSMQEAKDLVAALRKANKDTEFVIMEV